MTIDSIPNLYDAQNNKTNEVAFTKSLLKAMFDLNDKFQLQQGIELNIYYDMTNNTKDSLLYVGDPLTLPADTAEKDSKDYRLIGALGNVDLEQTFKEKIRIVDKDLNVFELNDGQGIKHNSQVYQNLNKRKMRRRFIDSSFGIKQDLKDFLIDEATEEKWFEILITRLTELIKV